jgi:putative oxidoreductase
MKKNLLTEILIAILVLIFAYTACSKFLDYEKFVFQMQLAPIPLMKWAAPILGVVMPLLETGIVFGLLFERSRLLGLYASITLLILFEIYINAMLLTGLHLPCTCGGFISKMSWKQHLWFNAVLILISWASIKLHYHKTNKPKNLPSKSAEHTRFSRA